MPSSDYCQSTTADGLDYSLMNCDMNMVSSPLPHHPPPRCMQQHQGCHHIGGIGGIVPCLCLSWIEFLSP